METSARVFTWTFFTWHPVTSHNQKSDMFWINYYQKRDQDNNQLWRQSNEWDEANQWEKHAINQWSPTQQQHGASYDRERVAWRNVVALKTQVRRSNGTLCFTPRTSILEMRNQFVAWVAVLVSIFCGKIYIFFLSCVQNETKTICNDDFLQFMQYVLQMHYPLSMDLRISTRMLPTGSQCSILIEIHLWPCM